jgi:hypothetical protein
VIFDWRRSEDGSREPSMPPDDLRELSVPVKWGLTGICSRLLGKTIFVDLAAGSFVSCSASLGVLSGSLAGSAGFLGGPPH